MSRPNVMVVTRWHPTAERPGWAPFLLEWTAVSAELAHVTVVHLDETHTGAVTEGHTSEGHPLVRVPLRGSGVTDPLGHVRDVSFARRELSRLVHDRGIDLIHAHAYPAGLPLVGVDRRIPVLLTEHFTRLIRGDFGLPQQVEARLAYRRAGVVTVVGPSLRAAVDPLARRSTVVEIPNPLSPELRASPLPSWPPFRVVAAGRLERIKGFDILLRAVAGARAAGMAIDLDIYGAGSQQDTLRALASELGVGDVLRGPAPRAEVWQAIRGAHLVAVPSRVETFSLVAAEALALGRPVVVTRSGGPEAFVQSPWHGEVVRPGDAAVLADAIITVLERLDGFPPDLGHEIRSQFAISGVVDRLAPHYRRLVEDRGHRRS